MPSTEGVVFCVLRNKMIDRKLILDNAPSNMGEQIHINHTGCEAGEDKKRRLYIKRSDKGLVAYCHHCNESQFVADSNRLASWINKPAATTKVAEKPVLAELTAQGKVWLRMNYCTITDPLFHGVAGEREKVALTLHNPQQQVIGWQIRNLAPNATPKYITHYVTNSTKGQAAWFHKESKKLVITEDYLSAYRVHRDTGYSSVALLRTTMTDKTLLQIYDLNFEFVMIWLDPDEAGTKGTSKLYKQLNHFLPSETRVAIFGMDKEPKECAPDELAKILL
jgi:hypothetical protein